ncbi:Pinoresinol reductase 2-like protein 1 [Colletotrichum musicola]|uniref:Pinoresinol reductase 2-like protein 1 n=1 Tax=Colletotrichum musicola TaxID=2175873 RepID=A0A8H6JBS2_9PEZI|nr:Pinoresinol reductase 2-like protein 1 [Colletotrichum musicola]
MPVVFTHNFDVGRFDVALLGRPSWSEETVIIGNKLTFHELASLAEKAKGTKLAVVHDSVEDLEACKLTELSSHREVYKLYPKEVILHSLLFLLGLACERGQANLNPGGTLNDELPEIRPIRAREVLEKGWGKLR